MSKLFDAAALVVPFENLRNSDVESVGGKNASLGEMISQLPTGVKVPTGFATTAHAFREFLKHDGLDQKINAKLAALDTEDVRALAQVGAEIRALVEAQPFPADLENAIREAYATLSGGSTTASFAVRSSATAEDLPDASFAGQQESFLNVMGIEEVLHKMCLHRFTTTAPFLIASTKASRMRMWRSVRACSAWCAQIWAQRA
jgi:pyruvate, water dikinase